MAPTREDFETAEKVFEYLVEDVDILPIAMTMASAIAAELPDEVSPYQKQIIKEALSGVVLESIALAHNAIHQKITNTVDMVDLAAEILIRLFKERGVGELFTIALRDANDGVCTIKDIAKTLGVEPDPNLAGMPVFLHDLTGNDTTKKDFLNHILTMPQETIDSLKALVQGKQDPNEDAYMSMGPLDIVSSTKEDSSPEGEGIDDFEENLRKAGIL